MTHSNTQLWPLPFPTEDQLKQISSYSSLANAPGDDPGRVTRRRQGPGPAKSGAVTDVQAIYWNKPPVSNPLYPYPARNVLNPGTFPEKTPLPVSNGSCPSNASVTRSENSDQKEPPRFPTQYHCLPQPFFVGLRQTGVEFPAVHFLRKRNKEPYTVWGLLTMDTMPDLVSGDLPILVEMPERWIKIKLNWPGYSRYPFEKRVPTKRGAPLTRTLLLMALAYQIDEFVRWIQKEGAVVELGQEPWAITGVSDEAPAMWKNCVITSLQHRTGSTWQPEIYYPSG